MRNKEKLKIEIGKVEKENIIGDKILIRVNERNVKKVEEIKSKIKRKGRSGKKNRFWKRMFDKIEKKIEKRRKIERKEIIKIVRKERIEGRERGRWEIEKRNKMIGVIEGEDNRKGKVIVYKIEKILEN